MNDTQLFHLAQTHGTPCYVYDVAIIERHIQTLRQYFPNAELYYALKANAYPAILDIFRRHGLGAEVISQGEILSAKRAELPLVIGGPRQDAAMIEAALESPSPTIRHISLDSSSQWENWKNWQAKGNSPSQNILPKAPFLIRLNPQLDPKTHPHLATGAAHSKFGLPFEQVIALAHHIGEQLNGFHVHAGSQIRDISIYDTLLQQLAELFRRFPHAKTLNIGGGFAVPDFDMARFSEKIQGFVEELELKLILEPGRFLVAEAGVLLTRVLHRKETTRTHIICDASMATLLRPALYHAEHPIRKLGSDTIPTETVDIQGCLCENSDILGRDRHMPYLDKGDIVVIEQAGAYGASMASHYAGSQTPVEVMIDSRNP